MPPGGRGVASRGGPACLHGDMSQSLFLDPFQDPAESSSPHADEQEPIHPAGDGAWGPSSRGETVPGEVLDSAAAIDRAKLSVSVAVPLDVVDAVGAFLEDTHLWWPRDEKATEPDAHVFFAEAQLLEEGSEGELHRWGRVLDASDDGLELEWLGRGPQHAAGNVTSAPGVGHTARSAAGSVAGAGATPSPDQGTRVYLSWRAVQQGQSVQQGRRGLIEQSAPPVQSPLSGGAVLTARGTGSGQWLGEWTALLRAFARFTGGRLMEAREEPAAPGAVEGSGGQAQD